jgi:hypothetical protein
MRQESKDARGRCIVHPDSQDIYHPLVLQTSMYRDVDDVVQIFPKTPTGVTVSWRNTSFLG